MDLALTPAQEALAANAWAAFSSGGAAPIVEGALTELAVVARELGRAAVPSTFHTDVLARLLGWRGEPGTAAVTLSASDGAVDFVAHARRADVLLVAGDGGEVVEVDLHAPGVSIEPQRTIADDERCRVVFAGAPVLGERTVDVAGAIARAAVVLAADAVGAATAAMEAAVARVQERVQYGAPLATLQAVQHRCADMLVDVTLAADAVFDAAGIADRGEPEPAVRLAASYAKATAVERCRRVTASAHQLAGGQGILADRPFHRWYRRVKAAEPALGSLRAHRATIAAALLSDRGPTSSA